MVSVSMSYTESCDGLQPYDSLLRPLQKWLDERGVRFALDTPVMDLAFSEDRDNKRLQPIVYKLPASFLVHCIRPN
jgi:myosin-crossreactive antigen